MNGQGAGGGVEIQGGKKGHAEPISRRLPSRTKKALASMFSSLAPLLAALLLHSSAALDNGLALTPPMGWRSWNCYHGDVSEDKIKGG